MADIIRLRSGIASALLLVAATAAMAQSDNSPPADSVTPHPYHWIAPFAGAYFGGFPLIAEPGVRVGVNLFDRILSFNADIGFIAGPASLFGEYTFRGALSLPFLRGIIDPYIHGYYRLVGKGQAFGGGVGYRRNFDSSSHWFAQVDLEITYIRFGIVDGVRVDPVQ